MERSAKVLASKGDAVSRALCQLGGHPDQRVQAVRSLEVLAQSAEGRSSIIASGGAKMLVAQLVRPGDQVLPFEKIRLANTLAILATSPPCRAVIINAAAIPQLIRLLGGLPEAQEAATDALTALAAAKGSRTLMFECGVLDVIERALTTEDAVGRRRFCRLLAALLEGDSLEERLPRVCAAIDSATVVSSVVAQLTDPEGVEQAAAVVALMSCQTGLRVRLMQAGALSVLKDLLCVTTREILEQALTALAAIVTVEMAPQGEEAEDLGTALVEDALSSEVPKIVQLLQGQDEEIRCAAAQTIFQLAARGDMEMQLRLAEPLPPLVALVKDGKARTRAWAVSALRLLGNSSEARETITQAVPMEAEEREKLLAKIRTLCF
ncbi:unnamed protein product [Symbiodinium sp. CCMP2592]|nr:unnamed protein product [Symbiodinium sp. CCMP2592]